MVGGRPRPDCPGGGDQQAPRRTEYCRAPHVGTRASAVADGAQVVAGSREGRGRRSDPPVREDAYTRIALRLREISAEDREWLLSHLGADDCQRVSAALQEYRARNVARPTGATN